MPGNNVRDFSFFIQNIHLPQSIYFPKNDYELVAKIMAYFHTEIVVDNVSDTDMPALAKIFEEYFENNPLINKSIQEFIDSLLVILVDNDKLGLLTIFSNTGDAARQLEILLAPHHTHFARAAEPKNIPLFNSSSTKEIKKCGISITSATDLFPEKNLKHAKDLIYGLEFNQNVPVNELKLDYLDDQIILGNNLDVNRIYFQLFIDRLQEKPNLSRSDLFTKEDFIVFLTGGSGERSRAQIKLGNLFIEIACGGKGSLAFDIYYIDNNRNGLLPLMNCMRPRYSRATFDYEHCLPFSASMFGLQTRMDNRLPPSLTRDMAKDRAKDRLEADELNNLINLREIFLGLALGRTICDFPNLKQELKKFYGAAIQNNVAPNSSFFKSSTATFSPLLSNESQLKM